MLVLRDGAVERVVMFSRNGYFFHLVAIYR